LISGLVIGLIVGVMVVGLLITEVSTIFLNNRNAMKELGTLEKKVRYNYWNGIFLISTFFIFRIIFLGVLLGAYIIPILISYPYKKTAAEIGWYKIYWA
jgi:hypothetical protein